MKRWWSIMVALVAVMTVTSLAFAASSPSPAPASKAKAATVEVEGKVLAVGKGWVEVEVSKIMQGQALRQGAKIRFYEAARLKVLEKGKAVGLTALKAGEMVDVSATVATVGKSIRYTATSISILR